MVNIGNVIKNKLVKLDNGKITNKEEKWPHDCNFLILRNIYVFKREKCIKSINIHNIMY